jgi:prophage regulatory protein
MENKINTYCVLRMKDLPKKIGFQPSTIYELIAKGKFPAPFKLVQGGKASGWLESTIDSWIENAARQSEGEQ